MSLSADFLLQGAYYAAEQAGLLLGDARVLFERGRHSTSMVLAAFCREAIGRAIIYLEERKKVLQSSTVTVKQLRKRCEGRRGHLETQQYGQTLVQQRFTLAMLKGVSPGTSLLAWSGKHLERKRAHMAHKTHEKRVRALYVEPNETGNRWMRPSKIEIPECKALLLSVAEDYDRFFQELQRLGQQEWAAFLATWKDRPSLPRPLYPSPKPKKG